MPDLTFTRLLFTFYGNTISLKKLASISFLFLLLLLHYSRVLNYLECQAIPALSTQAIVRCDCEKVADQTAGSGQSATGNPVSKLKPEEVFAGNETTILSRPIAGIILKSGRGPGQPIPSGHTASIFQPPRS